jgi:hypothetical protein
MLASLAVVRLLLGDVIVQPPNSRAYYFFLHQLEWLILFLLSCAAAMILPEVTQFFASRLRF